MAMDDQLDRYARPSRIPLAVWLLLLAALLHLAVSIAPDWYRLFGPYLLVEPAMVIRWIRAVSPFLLAAAVILGAVRWPGGRRALLFGAGALGVVGLLAMGLDVWLAVWELSPAVMSDGVQAMLIGRAIAAAVVFVAAYALLALGLREASRVSVLGVRRRALIGASGLAGVVALVAGLWGVSRWLDVSMPPATLGLYIGFGILTSLGAPAMAALAIAALRTMPRGGALPEALIAMGAIATMGGITWEFVLPSAIPMLDYAPEMDVWLFMIPAAIIVLGLMTMIGGFGAGRALRSPRAAGGVTA